MTVNKHPLQVPGFRFAGVSAGLKSTAGQKDLALCVADAPAAAAALFTLNRVRAAPVLLAREHLRKPFVRAVVANSGSANCLTGQAGLRLAQRSCALAGRLLGCVPEAVIPCSTGVIGHLYDFNRYRDGLKAAVAELRPDGAMDFANAILTTDTRPKTASVQVQVGGSKVTILGIAKGAGMLAPQLATMLAFIFTDASASPALLGRALRSASAESFNAITVDGDTSTNDTVLILASARAGNRPLNGPAARRFIEAVGEVASALAHELVADGEGATKVITVEVTKARSRAEAIRAALKIANSPLVKTAFFGADPNVGRILASAGASGVALDPAKLGLVIGNVRVASQGRILSAALPKAAAAMKQREFSVRVELGIGNCTARVLTTDLTYDYVRINAEYTT